MENWKIITKLQYFFIDYNKFIQKSLMHIDFSFNCRGKSKKTKALNGKGYKTETILKRNFI